MEQPTTDLRTVSRQRRLRLTTSGFMSSHYMFPGPSDFGPRCFPLQSDSLINVNFILTTLSGTKLGLNLMVC